MGGAGSDDWANYDVECASHVSFRGTVPYEEMAYWCGCEQARNLPRTAVWEDRPLAMASCAWVPTSQDPTSQTGVCLSVGQGKDVLMTYSRRRSLMRCCVFLKRSSCACIPSCMDILLSNLFFIMYCLERALSGSKPIGCPAVCLLHGDVNLKPYFSTALYMDHNAMVRSFEAEASTLPSGE